MRSWRSGRTLAGILAVFVVIVVALGLTFRTALGAWLIPKIVGSATGTNVAFGGMQLHGNNATFTGVRVTSHAGQKIAYIPRLYITYDLRGLLPGSNHRFGLLSLLVEHPQILIIHNRDGTYNIPKQNAAPTTARQAAPLNFTATVVEGTLTMIDYTRVDPDARQLYVDNVNLGATINTAAHTRYTAAMNYREGSRLYPIHGTGAMDAATAFTLHRWTAARVPLPRLVNFGLNNANIHMMGGALENVNLRYFGKLAASAYMSGAKVRMTGVSQPVRNGHGEMDVYEGGLTTPGLFATVGTMPVRVTGAIMDLRSPQFRMAVNASGDIAQLKKLHASTANLPMSGAVSAAMLVEGTVKKPLVLIRLASPRVDYRGIGIENPHGLLAFDGQEADIFGFSLGYHAFTVNARGRMALKSQPNAVQMVAQLRGPSDAIPYASSMLPGLQLHGTVLASGNDLRRIDTHGVLEGAGAQETLAALFSINSAGTGTAGPLMIDGGDRSLYGRVTLDRPHNSVAALVSARNFALTLPQPAVSATMTGDVYADKRGNALGMLGNVNMRDAKYGRVEIADANARFGGGVGDVRVSKLDARGSFGTLDAAGTISGTNHVALEGTYRGSLDALSQFGGNLPAHGSVNAPIALVYDGGRAVAQIHNAHFTNASVRGVPITGLSATIGTHGKEVQIYAAQATLARSAQARVAGALGHGQKMVVSVSNLDMAALHASGVPLQSGRADLAATVSGSMTAPNVNGALLLENGKYQRYPIDLQSAFAYSGDTLHLRDGMVGLGPAYVAIDGSVGGVAIGKPMLPQYDLNAALHGADAHALVAMAQPRLAKEYIEGSIDANVHVGGEGRDLAVNGMVDVPAGSVHGLAFRDLHGKLSGTGQNFGLRDGYVQIGTTAVAFAAGMSHGAMQASLRAPQADLADFNDYFDTGDTLAGTGSLALNVDTGRGTFLTSGNVDLSGVRFRRFEIGQTVANWQTHGRTVAMIADVGGESGRGHVRGSVTVPPFNSMAELVTNADTNLTATVSDADLGTWLPMMGMTAPVTGKLNATARVNGRFPNESLDANAAIQHGTVGRVEVQRAEVAVTALRGRGSLQHAIVQIPYLNATGSGTFGLHARDPLNLSLHGTSPDIGKLMAVVNGQKRDISGALDTTLRVTGTRLDPTLDDTLTLDSLRYGKFTIPRISGTINATRTQVAIQNGLVSFKRGSIELSGLVPISMSPHFQMDPGNKPVRLALTANNVDFSNFEEALPKGTRLAGTIGGAMTVNGTVNNPLLNGTLALHNGYFVGPIDQNPIQKLTGELAFNGTSLALYNLHADVGGGTMDLNGHVSVPDVRDIRDATFHTTIVAKGAQFNSPQYFRGKIDANIVASRDTPRSVPMIAGTVYLPTARIPLSAFWNPHAPKGPARKLPNIAMKINATVGNDVRVQSSNVDVGAQGSVTLGGTLPNPQLSGQIASTGGSVDFFRRFIIEQANIRFDPSNGIMPYINATATTRIPDPVTYIALNVSGLAPDNMQIAFSSDPSYDRAQIMGLLAGVNQFNRLGQGGGAIGGFSVASTIQNMAVGQLNTFFTQQLLEPLSASLGNALGLQNLQLTDDFHSGFGIAAVKAFGKHMTFQYRQTLGTPRRQTLSFQVHRGDSTAFDLTIYQVDSPALLSFQNSSSMFGYLDSSSLMNPMLGTHGVTFSYQHRFQ